jgi:glycosyltransferase involved in cell wall biosynthesis
MSAPLKTVCIIPAFNEEDTIEDAVLETKDYVDEVIVVDDGSVDETASRAIEAGAFVISHQSNMGVGKAFASGINYALSIGADVAVTFDADGQFKATEIPNLITPISEGRADFVTGSRFINRIDIPDMPLSKRIGNIFFTRMVNLLSGGDFTDTQCGFRAYSRESMLRLTVFGQFTYTQEVFLDLMNKNLRVVEVHVEVLPRRVGRSKVVKNPIDYGLRALKIIIQSERDYRPLRFFSIISLLFLFPGLLALGIVSMNWIITGMTSPYTSLIYLGGILSVVAIIFIVLALIADMNGRQRFLLEEMLYLMRKEVYEPKRGGKDL